MRIRGINLFFDWSTNCSFNLTIICCNYLGPVCLFQAIFCVPSFCLTIILFVKIEINCVRRSWSSTSLLKIYFTKKWPCRYSFIIWRNFRLPQHIFFKVPQVSIFSYYLDLVRLLSNFWACSLVGLIILLLIKNQSFKEVFHKNCRAGIVSSFGGFLDPFLQFFLLISYFLIWRGVSWVWIVCSWLRLVLGYGFSQAE